jgi:ribosomal protein S18 acetylase RimI-like enzyme
MAPTWEELSSNGIALRRASAEDREFLVRVYASTREEELAALAWSPAQREGFLRMQFDVRLKTYAVAYPSAETSVVYIGDAAAGSIIISRGSNEIRLVDIALLSEFRTRGVGGSLIRALISEARRAGGVLKLAVLRGNRAAHLYERLGFVATGGDAMYCEMELRPAATTTNHTQENTSRVGKAE